MKVAEVIVYIILLPILIPVGLLLLIVKTLQIADNVGNPQRQWFEDHYGDNW